MSPDRRPHYTTEDDFTRRVTSRATLPGPDSNNLVASATWRGRVAALEVATATWRGWIAALEMATATWRGWIRSLTQDGMINRCSVDLPNNGE
jgi:hypothetical protein